jgi:NADPH:quinone reductase-like Zn-dependent oxidoreductase
VLHDHDVVQDSLRGHTLQQSLKVLKPHGKVINVAGVTYPFLFLKAGGDQLGNSPARASGPSAHRIDTPPSAARKHPETRYRKIVT